MTTLYPGLDEAATVGGTDVTLTDAQIRDFVHHQLAALDVDGKRVTLVVPDGTRHAPVDVMTHHVRDALADRPASLRIVIALGTHDYMSEEAIAHLLGYAPGRFAQEYPGWEVHNHTWRDEVTFANLGTIPRERIAELTDGRLTDRDMTVLVNSLVVDTDISLVLGPVLPHEVVGISGGNKQKGELPSGAIRAVAAWTLQLRGLGAPVKDAQANKVTALVGGDDLSADARGGAGPRRPDARRR